MAVAATASLQRSLNQIAGGLVVSHEEGAPPCGTVAVMRGDHPAPGASSFAAAARIGDLTTRMKSGDVAVVLVSGGTSSLIAAPLRDMAEQDLTRLFEMLLASGLDIEATNAVRKRFLRWGGGRLALAIAPASTHCFAVSDVIGDDLGTIGSGPCVPDKSTVFDVIDILKDSRLYDRLSRPFRAYLEEAARGTVPETPKPTHPAFAHVTARVIANNRGALDAAAERARALGAEAVYVVDAPLTGEAASRGEEVARWLVELSAQNGRGHAPRVVVWGGEPTVTLQAAAPAPSRKAAAPASAPPGGRCQELALAAARVLGDAGERADGIVLLAAGTDGRDGPTDAAGAFVDRNTWGAIRAASLDPAKALADHASHGTLDAVGALFRPGPTGTNVMDIVIGVIDAR